jgi:hypothetical protein
MTKAAQIKIAYGMGAKFEARRTGQDLFMIESAVRNQYTGEITFYTNREVCFEFGGES